MVISSLMPALSMWQQTLAAVLLCLSYVIIYHLNDKLASIPTVHWSAKWSRCHALWIKCYGSTKLDYYQAHTRYKGSCRIRPLIRVAPNEVSVMTSEAIKIGWDGGFERSPWYEVFVNFGVLNMFSFSSSRAHKQRRRVFASAYSKSAIAHFQVQQLIKARTAKLRRFIDRQADSDRFSPGKTGPIVVRNIFRALQADVFTAFAFSEHEGTRYLDKLEEGANTLEDMDMGMMDLCHDDRRERYFFWESEKPFKYVAHFIDRNGPIAHKTAERWITELATRYETRINGKKSQSSVGATGVYGKMLYWKEPGSGLSLSPDERVSEMLDHTVAGQDAVAAVLEFICRQLSIHQDVQAHLRLELSTFTPMAAEDCNFAMIDELAYLNAVVMESLRLVDTISSYQTRVVPHGGCEISGHFLPAGTVLAAQPYLINRIAKNFHDPDIFDPSRWLLSRDDHRVQLRNLWTYSSGPTACIGRDFSLAVIKTVIVDIYTRYITRLANEDRIDRRSRQGAERMAEIDFERYFASGVVEDLDKEIPKKSMHPPLGALSSEQVRPSSGLDVDNNNTHYQGNFPGQARSFLAPGTIALQAEYGNTSTAASSFSHNCVFGNKKIGMSEANAYPLCTFQTIASSNGTSNGGSRTFRSVDRGISRRDQPKNTPIKVPPRRDGCC